MTLPASGSTTAADIRSELRLGASEQFTIAASSSNAVNWLGERNGASITIPTHLYGKAAVKYVGSTAFTSSGTVHTIAGVNFGPTFTGRSIFVVAELLGKASTVTSGWNLAGIIIGGVSISDVSPFCWQGGNPSTNLVGGARLNAIGAVGTSGTITCNSTQVTQIRYHVMSVANHGASTDFVTDIGTGNFTGAATAGSNGLAIGFAGCFRTAGATTMSWSAGLTNTSVNDVTGINRFIVGWQNRFSVGSKTFSVTAGATHDGGIMSVGTI